MYHDYLIKNKYEIMGSCCYADDAIEMMNYYKENGSYVDIQICRYKRWPGQEDAYAVMCLSENDLWDSIV